MRKGIKSCENLRYGCALWGPYPKAASIEYRCPLRSSNPSGPILIPTLDLDSATNRIHDARKLRQHAIAGGVENALAMLLDFRADEFAAMRFETIERALFVGANQARLPATWATKIARDARQKPLPGNPRALDPLDHTTWPRSGPTHAK